MLRVSHCTLCSRGCPWNTSHLHPFWFQVYYCYTQALGCTTKPYSTCYSIMLISSKCSIFLCRVFMLPLYLDLHVHIAVAPGRWQASHPSMLNTLYTLLNTILSGIVQTFLRDHFKHAMVHNDFHLSIHVRLWLKMSSIFTTSQSLAKGVKLSAVT